MEIARVFKVPIQEKGRDENKWQENGFLWSKTLGYFASIMTTE